MVASILIRIIFATTIFHNRKGFFGKKKAAPAAEPDAGARPEAGVAQAPETGAPGASAPETAAPGASAPEKKAGASSGDSKEA